MDTPQIIPLVFPASIETEEKVRITRPTLGGRASGMPNARSVQLFGSIASVDTSPNDTFIPLDTVVGATGVDEGPPRDACQRLWRVRSDGAEVIRSTNATLAPLTRQQITEANPAGIGQVSGLKLVVSFGTRSGFSQLRMDVGETLDIVADRVSVGLLSTPNAIEVGSNRQAQPPGTRSGVVFDTLVGFALHMIEEADCHCETTYTQHVVIPVTTAVSIPVPRFATKLRVMMGNGTSTASWEKMIGDLVAVLPVGFIEFNAAGTTSTDESEDLGNASFIRTSAEAGIRFATLIWTIRP